MRFKYYPLMIIYILVIVNFNINTGNVYSEEDSINKMLYITFYNIEKIEKNGGEVSGFAGEFNEIIENIENNQNSEDNYEKIINLYEITNNINKDISNKTNILLNIIYIFIKLFLSLSFIWVVLPKIVLYYWVKIREKRFIEYES